MRHLVLGALCTLMTITIFTTSEAEAGRRRRCRSYYKTCVQTAPCANWSGNACATVNYAPVNYAPVHAACAPAQPVTYSAGYAPMSNATGTQPAAPLPPQNIEQPSANSQFESPPTPQPVE